MKLCGLFFSEPGSPTAIIIYSGLGMLLIMTFFLLRARSRRLNQHRKGTHHDTPFEYDMAYQTAVVKEYHPPVQNTDIFNLRNLEANRGKLAEVSKEFEDNRTRFHFLVSSGDGSLNEEESEELGQKMKNLETVYHGLEQKLEMMHTRLIREDEFLQYKRQVVEKDEELSKLKGLVTKLRTELDTSEQARRSTSISPEQTALEEESKKLSESLEKEKKEKDAILETVVSLTDSIHNMEERIHLLEKDLDEKRNRISSLESELAQASQNNGGLLESEMSQLMEERKQLENRIREKESEVARLKNQLDQENSKYEELKNTLEAVKTDFDRSIEGYKDQADKLVQTEYQSGILQKEMEELRNKMEELKMEGERRMAAFDAKVRHIQYQDEKLDELIQVNHNLKETINAQAGAIEKQQHQNKELKKLIEKKKDMLAKIYSELGSAIGGESQGETSKRNATRRAIIKDWE